jgi:hypothetical protein
LSKADAESETFFRSAATYFGEISHTQRYARDRSAAACSSRAACRTSRAASAFIVAIALTVHLHWLLNRSRELADTSDPRWKRRLIRILAIASETVPGAHS